MSNEEISLAIIFGLPALLLTAVLIADFVQKIKRVQKGCSCKNCRYYEPKWQCNHGESIPWLPTCDLWKEDEGF